METFASTFDRARALWSLPVRRVALGVLGAVALGAVGALGVRQLLADEPAWGQFALSGFAINQFFVPTVLGALGASACVGLAAQVARGQLLRLATRNKAGACTVRTRVAVRADAEGTLVGVVAWPGVLVADGYRAMVVGAERSDGRGLRRVVGGLRAIVKYRAGLALGAAGTLFLATLLTQTWLAGLAMAACGGLLLAASMAKDSDGKSFFSRGTRAGARRALWTGQLPLLATWGTLSVGLSVLAACCAIAMVAGVSPVAFAPVVVVLGLLGVVSLGPLGIGLALADVAAFAALTTMFGVPAPVAAMAVIVARLAVHGPAWLIGAASLALRVARGTTAMAQLRARSLRAMRADAAMAVEAKHTDDGSEAMQTQSLREVVLGDAALAAASPGVTSCVEAEAKPATTARAA